MTTDERLAFLVANSRALTFTEGYAPDKSSVSTAKPGESIFKGISKAAPARPLAQADHGLFHVELTSREYDVQRFTGPTISEALEKACRWVEEHTPQ